MMELILFSSVLCLTLAGVASNPLMQALYLIASSALISLKLSAEYSSWLTLSLVLIFLGGMMVIFLYFTSLVGNEKVAQPLPKTGALAMLFISFSTLVSLQAPSHTLPGLLNFNSLHLLGNTLLLAYLIYTLFVVVALSSSFKGSLELSSF